MAIGDLGGHGPGNDLTVYDTTGFMHDQDSTSVTVFLPDPISAKILGAELGVSVECRRVQVTFGTGIAA